MAMVVGALEEQVAHGDWLCIIAGDFTAELNPLPCGDALDTSAAPTCVGAASASTRRIDHLLLNAAARRALVSEATSWECGRPPTLGSLLAAPTRHACPLSGGPTAVGCMELCHWGGLASAPPCPCGHVPRQGVGSA